MFDMDGTLTVPVINFAEMYREVLGDEAYKLLRSQNPNESIDILHHIDGLETPEEKKKAYDIIVRFEKQGLDRLQIMPGEQQNKDGIRISLSLFLSRFEFGCLNLNFDFQIRLN